MSPHFLGLDVGGTVAKAAVFDEAGDEVAVASVAMRDSHPRPGWTERDPEAMWSAAAGAIRHVLRAPGTSAARVVALACTGHGNGVYPVDAEGMPAMPGIVSSDGRGEAICAEFEQRPDSDALVARFGQRFRACSMPVLLTWLDRHQPWARERIAHLLLCKDYLRLRLTGRLASELSDVSGCGILDLERRDYDDALLDSVGLLQWRDKLPALLSSSAIAGCVTAPAAAVTGLIEGTPVAAGMMDVDAVTLGSGVRDGSRIAVCGGTWSINLVLSRDLRAGPYPLLQTLHRDGEFRTICEGSLTSASNLTGLLEVARQPTPDYAQINARVAALDPEASSLVYLPFIHGADGAPKASFVGLDSTAGPAHLLRAIFEGVAFEHARHVDEVIKLSGSAARRVRLSGGIAKSEVWAQMIADVTGMPVEVAHGQELGALGSAICAAVATGWQPDFTSAVDAMTRVERSYEPSHERTLIYRRKRGNHERVRDALVPVWPGFDSRV